MAFQLVNSTPFIMGLEMDSLLILACPTPSVNGLPFLRSALNGSFHHSDTHVIGNVSSVLSLVIATARANLPSLFVHCVVRHSTMGLV